ncbi:MAG: glycosyl hydrolase [Arcicella sp.]|nr:glycosyl hydrolase [Arcicella sp.]
MQVAYIYSLAVIFADTLKNEQMRIIFLLILTLLNYGCSKETTSIIIQTTNTPRPTIGFNQNWTFLPVLNNTMLKNIKSLKPEMIRYPGGTITHSWDWVNGIKIGSSTIPHPIQDIKTMADATSAKFIFVVDIVNKTIEDQILMLNSIKNLGIPINYIELGNELYGQDNEYVTAFPTGTEYALKATIWAIKLKEVFPNAKIAALLQCRNSNSTNTRLNQWNGLVVSGTNSSVDAYTYHIYIPVGGNCKARTNEFETVANATNTSNKELWITEYGNQNDKTDINYLPALDSLANYIESYPKVTLVLNHLIVGDNKNKLTSDGITFTSEGNLFLNRASKR